ncbi:YjbE family putative metal transport protein [Candidatus Magnetominusculus dajiuhuensis]|uniref:YjbE family putative metal transport protein n=1 Tax=Candidatus Magnetominusculus dajiuhuensis TaxID=3137712 RepID=UPI003B434CC2
MDLTLFYDFLNIILVNLALSSDNAVVLAMAVKSLPKKSRKKGLVIGAACSFIINIVLIFYVSELLQLKYVRFVGGAIITMIALKRCVEISASEAEGDQSTNILHAIKIIVIANLTMSFDNVMGVAAVSKGNLNLLILGLAISIPIVFLASNILAALLDRYPFIIYISAAVLGRIGAELALTDPFIANLFHPEARVTNFIEILYAAAVVTIGILMRKRKLLELSKTPC